MSDVTNPIWRHFARKVGRRIVRFRCDLTYFTVEFIDEIIGNCIDSEQLFRKLSSYKSNHFDVFDYGWDGDRTPRYGDEDPLYFSIYHPYNTDYEYDTRNYFEAHTVELEDEDVTDKVMDILRGLTI